MRHGFRKPRRRRGVILSLLAVLAVFLVAMVMFFVDVAYMQLVRTELQAATDAATKAACESIDASSSAADIQQVAIDVAAANRVGGRPLVLSAADIEVGSSDLQADGSWLFRSGAMPYTAVRINAEMSNAKASGAVDLFFADSIGAGEFTPQQSSVASQFDHEIVLCVDRSHSMCFDFSGVAGAYPDPDEDDGWNESLTPACHRPHIDSRWSAIQTAVGAFLSAVQANNGHEQQRVGLVTWASDHTSDCTGTFYPAARVDVPLTLSFSQVQSALNQLGSQTMPGGTNISAGLSSAMDLLTSSSANPLAKKTIIVFSDGQWNQGSAPSTLNSTLAASNITLHVVTLLDNVDMTEMEDLATNNGGIHYNASSESELIAAFQTLARSLPVVLTD